MNFSEPFIKRPIGTTLIAIGLFLVGAVAYQLLPVASMPTVDFPTISVSANRPGADPETMAATVAAPLERRLGEIPGVTELTSRSSLGSSAIRANSFSSAASLRDVFVDIQMTEQPDLFVEIGAYDAALSFEMRSVLPAARVVAFEANPYNFTRHSRTRLMRSSGVEFVHSAIAETVGEKSFKLVSRRHNKKSSLLSRVKPTATI